MAAMKLSTVVLLADAVASLLACLLVHKARRRQHTPRVPTFATTPLVLEKSLPLAGRRILVTAPRSYAMRLMEQLQRRGARPIWMPTVATEPLQDNTELDMALQDMASAAAPAYAYVAFTSRNGIHAFISRAQALGLDSNLAALLRGCTVCAIGKDAQALVDAGIEVDLLPTEPSPTGLTREIETRGRGKLAGVRILVPVPHVVGVPEPNVVPDFVAGLETLGMAVHRVPAYSTGAIVSGNEVEEKLLFDGAVDAIAFSSTAEATALALRLRGRLAEAASKTTICCFGPITAKNVREELGLNVEVVSKNFGSFEGYADALADYFGTAVRPKK